MEPDNEIEGYCKDCKNYANAETDEPCKSCEAGSLREGSRAVAFSAMPTETLMLWSFFSGALMFGIGGFFVGLLF